MARNNRTKPSNKGIRIVCRGITPDKAKLYTHDGKEITGVQALDIQIRPNQPNVVVMQVLVSHIDVLVEETKVNIIPTTVGDKKDAAGNDTGRTGPEVEGSEGGSGQQEQGTPEGTENTEG